MAAENFILTPSSSTRPQFLSRTMAFFASLLARLRHDPPAHLPARPLVSASRAVAPVAPSVTDSEGLRRALLVVAEALPKSPDRWRRQFVGAVLKMAEGEVRTDFERRIRQAYRAGDHTAIANRAVARLHAIQAQRVRGQRADAIGAAAAYLQQRLPGLDDSQAASIAFGAVATFLRMDSESPAPLHAVDQAFTPRAAIGGLR